jgi:NDP-sugar pyrophosphorylase family protein
MILHKGNNINNIAEKPNLQHCVNSGTYCFSPDVLTRMLRECYLDMPYLFMGMIDERKICSGCNIPGTWLDIGAYAKLNRELALLDKS